MLAHTRQFGAAAAEEAEDYLLPLDDREQKPKCDDVDGDDDGVEDDDDGMEDDDDAAHDEPDRSSSSTDEAKEEEEFVMVNLSEIRKEVECPICLGIIRKTRTVMECLHRFCRECIDKSMRLGNKECPACRTHCASRRSLRDDPNYDALIAALYPDIDEYEEEELAFNEEEKARNKQIQETISQTLLIQSEASGKKRSSKRAATEIVRKSRLNLRDTPPRGRKKRRSELQVCKSDDISEDGRRESSSADECCYSEVKPKRCRTSGGAKTSQPSGSYENGLDGFRESVGTIGRFVGASERLAWGKGGTRSHTRHGNGSGSNSKNAHVNRISKLVDHLCNFKQKDDEMDMNLLLVPMNGQTMPNLQQPYLCCKPSWSVGNIRQYVAFETESQPDEIIIYLVKELQPKLNSSVSIDPREDKLQVLNEEERLSGLRIHNSYYGYVLLAYQRKGQSDER